MHRLRGVEALTERLPQAWVPRVVNLALAALLLTFLVPLFTHLGGRSLPVQVLLVVLGIPFAALTVACLLSAVAPGSLRKLARRRHPH